MTGSRPDNAGVKLPPPLIYALPLVAAWLIEKGFALPLPASGDPRPLGWTLIVLGALCTFPAAAAFLAAKTAIVPVRPATMLVTSGLYRVTRNPMYLGFTITYIGVTLLLGTWWAVIFLPFVLWAMHVLVIFREEHYLDARFGQAYRDYRSRVRRWI